MKDGFIKIAAGVPQVCVADTKANTAQIKKLILKAEEKNVNLLVLPELCITGYTCGDLFFSDKLISSALDSLKELALFTKGKYTCVIVGLPIKYNIRLYNCAAVLQDGEILGFVPKTFIANHGEFNEARYFESGSALEKGAYLFIDKCLINLGTNLIFKNSAFNDFSFCVEICEDLFAPNSTNQKSALNGANIIINSAACTQTVGKADYCKQLILADSSRLNCGYVFTSSGVGESSTDAVFGGYALIAENGQVLSENKPFSQNDIIVSEIDVKTVTHLKQKNATFNFQPKKLTPIIFEQKVKTTALTRQVERNPFLPSNVDVFATAEEILQIQSNALARRLEHTNAKTAVIGISGGLDSTLALLSCARAMKILKRPFTDILAVTMPCFGTTSRTRSNSEALCKELGVSFKEINITDSVKQHFKDIGQSENEFDVTYENSQARERTQVLMDIANKQNGIVIGTGDLSELALGWATYNGDHMSMYGINSGIPKTLIKHLVNHEVQLSNGTLKQVLLDILDTPVSPELLPADEKGEIAQKTEDLVGPYELHDFFLYHTVGYGETPSKIFRLASLAFPEYSKETIIHWLRTFTRRFFNQQFKRSCLPDGPKINTVSLSPRGDWQMPSDAVSKIWLDEIDSL